MARRFVLVPEKQMQQSNPPVNFAPPTVANIINDEINYDAIINIMPKPLRHKTKVVLHHLQPRLDVNDKVIYPDETVGSHLYSLLKYFLSDLPSKQPRPPDGQKFEELMKNKVPDHLFKCRQANNLWKCIN